MRCYLLDSFYLMIMIFVVCSVSLLLTLHILTSSRFRAPLDRFFNKKRRFQNHLRSPSSSYFILSFSFGKEAWKLRIPHSANCHIEAVSLFIIKSSGSSVTGSLWEDWEYLLNNIWDYILLTILCNGCAGHFNLSMYLCVCIFVIVCISNLFRYVCVCTQSVWTASVSVFSKSLHYQQNYLKQRCRYRSY